MHIYHIPPYIATATLHPTTYTYIHIHTHTQAAFLAAKDSVTPLVAVVVGAMVNLVFDVLLVSKMGMGTCIFVC